MNEIEGNIRPEITFKSEDFSLDDTDFITIHCKKIIDVERNISYFLKLAFNRSVVDNRYTFSNLIKPDFYTDNRCEHMLELVAKKKAELKLSNEYCKEFKTELMRKNQLCNSLKEYNKQK